MVRGVPQLVRLLDVFGTPHEKLLLQTNSGESRMAGMGDDREKVNQSGLRAVELLS